MVGARWAWWVATAGGVGRVPTAPGTAGSVVGLVAAVLAARTLSPAWYAALLLGLFAVGVVAAQLVERTAPRKDPSWVVIDEVVGMMLALFLLPLRVGPVAAAFVCFRGFDIFKPFPIRRLEHQPGGWGIMLDDVVAGLYANVVVRGALWVLGAA